MTHPTVVLVVLGCDFHYGYLQWLVFTERAGCIPVLLYAPSHDLLERIAPQAIVLVRSIPSVGAVMVNHCSKSAGGAEMSAYVEAEARTNPKLKIEFQPRNPSMLADYQPDGLDVVLTDHPIQDTDAMDAIAAGIAKYLTSKGTH